MSGAWEITKPQVLVAILTREQVATAWARSYREMVLPPASAIIFLTGMPFDHARNSACESALQGGFEWLFFLDDDVVIPSQAISILLSHKLPIVSGLYYRRAQPIAPVALMDVKPKPTYIQGQLGNIMKVDLVGAGCLLIHRSVLESLGSKWFEWLMDKNIPEDERCSEDFAFCRKAKKAGFSIHLDTRVQCHHIGLGRSMAGGVYEPVSL